jgi:L-asparaginase II
LNVTDYTPAVKPIQAIPLVEDGVVDRLGITIELEAVDG